MVPTKRQMEYLEAVVALYQELKRPVHYSEVAEKLGVSVWTAHDLLTLLSDKGFLEQEYLIRRPGPSAGRSSVMFCPTRSAAEELEKEEWRPYAKESERQLRTHLLAKLDKAGQTGIEGVLSEAFEELPKLNDPLAFCANLVLILLICIWIAASDDYRRLDLDLLPADSNDESLLLFLAGLILGIVFKGRSEASVSEAGVGVTQRDANYLELALQNSDQRIELLSLVETVTKRISSQWALTGEEDRAILMNVADEALARALPS